MAPRCAPGDLRHDLCRVEFDHGVEVRAGVGMQRLPVGDGLVPLGAAHELAGDPVGAGRQQAALDVLDGLVVHGHQPGARTGLDRHVAYGHAAFHAQAPDRLAGELDGVAGAAGGADLADDGQHDVLGGDAGRHLAVHLDQHVAGLLGQQGLRGQHVLDLAGADAVRQRAKGAVRAGVAVAADHGHAGQGGAVLGADHVHDALALVQEGEEGGGAVLIDVGVERGDLFLADRVLDAVVAAFPAGGGRVVVGRGDH